MPVGLNQFIGRVAGPSSLDEVLRLFVPRHQCEHDGQPPGEVRADFLLTGRIHQLQSLAQDHLGGGGIPEILVGQGCADHPKGQIEGEAKLALRVQRLADLLT
jgi:hypothetical protein